jgi:hypothetical protein
MPEQVLKSFNLAIMGRTRLCARADTWVRPYVNIEKTIRCNHLKAALFGKACGLLYV